MKQFCTAPVVETCIWLMIELRKCRGRRPRRPAGIQKQIAKTGRRGRRPLRCKFFANLNLSIGCLAHRYTVHTDKTKPPRLPLRSRGELLFLNIRRLHGLGRLTGRIRRVVPHIAVHIRIGPHGKMLFPVGTEQIHMSIPVAHLDHVPEHRFPFTGAGYHHTLQACPAAHGRVNRSNGPAVTHTVNQ